MRVTPLFKIEYDYSITDAMISRKQKSLATEDTAVLPQFTSSAIAKNAKIEYLGLESSMADRRLFILSAGTN